MNSPYKITSLGPEPRLVNVRTICVVPLSPGSCPSWPCISLSFAVAVGPVLQASSAEYWKCIGVPLPALSGKKSVVPWQRVMSALPPTVLIIVQFVCARTPAVAGGAKKLAVLVLSPVNTTPSTAVSGKTSNLATLLVIAHQLLLVMTT